MTHLPTGAIAMLVTPFQEDGGVDLEAVARIAALALRQGAMGIALHGLAGEGAKLLDAERRDIIATVAQVAGGAPIIAGVDHESSYGSVRLALEARQAGATSVMAMPPKSSGGNRRRVVDYFADLEDKSQLPLVIQDAPRASGISMEIDALCEITKALRLACAIKVEDAVPSLKMRALGEALGAKRSQVLLYGGLGGRNFLQELEQRADGTVVGPAYIDFFAALIRAHDADVSSAVRLFRKVLPLLVAVEGNEWYARLQKELLYRAGFIANPMLRPPANQGDARHIEGLVALFAELVAVVPELGSGLGWPHRGALLQRRTAT